MSSLVPVTTTSTFQPTSTTSPPSFANTPTLTAPPVTVHSDYAGSHLFPPMTTHWNPPSSCTWTYVVDNNLAPESAGPVAWLDLEPIPGASTLSCYPHGMFFEGRTGVFSPGTCPHGWTTVSVSVNTNHGLRDATTTALCCSSEYSLVGGHCKRQVPTVLAVPIIYNYTAATYEVLTNSTTTLYSATIAVNTIRALFREEDKALLGLTDDSEMDDEPEKSHELSLSAKIGIGVGATLFGLLVMGAILITYLWRRENKKEHIKGQPSHELDAVHGGRAHFHGNSQHMPYRRSHAHDIEPPPAYDLTTETNSLADNESGNTISRDDEIRALMAQKAAIQRRLEELERGEGDEPIRDQVRNG